MAPAGGADRHPPRRHEADIAGAVGEDDGLLRHGEVAQRVDEALPVLGGDAPHQRLAAQVVVRQRGPGEGQHVAVLEELPALLQQV